MNVAGIVLAGGKSSRMGRPKASLPIGGETMLGRVVRVLGEVASPVVVVAAVGQELPALPDGVVVVRDEAPDLGPMQGLVTGLRYLVGRADAAFVSCCDAALLRAEFVRRMIELLDESLVAAPFVDDRLYPLTAVYRIGALPAAERMLAEGNRRVKSLMERVPTRLVRLEELGEVESLRNVNTPEEYRSIQ
jgi:molybdenum cofactor guanylyltransferase